MTIIVHHLNDSRSQRILWLLEELGTPYEVRRYERDPQTRLAPPELRAVHPLGKSPVISDGERTVIESGAIIQYLVDKFGAETSLQPPRDAADHPDYLQWMHYAEGSAMLPLMLNMYVARLGEAGAPLRPRIGDEIANHLGFVDGALAGKDYLLGDFTAADVQMSFVGEVAGMFGELPNYPNLAGWVERFQSRPAYARALAKGGAYSFARRAAQ